MTPQEHSAFFNQFRLFQLGASWGGFESLIVPAWPAPERSCTPLQKGSLIRVHAGLETGEDLIDDLSAAFDRLRAFRCGGRPLRKPFNRRQAKSYIPEYHPLLTRNIFLRYFIYHL